jgi:hypothetical protein
LMPDPHGGLAVWVGAFSASAPAICDRYDAGAAEAERNAGAAMSIVANQKNGSVWAGKSCRRQSR